MIILFLQTMESYSKISVPKFPKRGGRVIFHKALGTNPWSWLKTTSTLWFFSDWWKNSCLGDFIHLPDPVRYTQPGKGRGKTPKSQSFLCSEFSGDPSQPNTQNDLVCQHWDHKKNNSHQSTEVSIKSPCPGNWGLQTGTKTPLAAFFLHFPFESCTKDWLCMFRSSWWTKK